MESGGGGNTEIVISKRLEETTLWLYRSSKSGWHVFSQGAKLISPIHSQEVTGTYSRWKGARRLLKLIAVVLGLLGLPVLVAWPALASECAVTVFIRHPSPGDPLTPYGATGYYLYQQLESKLKENCKVGTKETAGSLSTILGVDSTPQSIGIVQADVLFHYLHGQHPNFPVPKKPSNVRAIARLFPEHLYLSYSGTRDKKEFLDLSTACGSTSGTGSLFTAINLRNVLEASWQRVHNCSDPAASKKVDPTDQPLEIRIVSPSVRRASKQVPKDDAVYLTKEMAEILENAYPGTYSAQQLDSSNGAATIAVDAVLVGSRDVSTKAIEELQRILGNLDDEVDDVLASEKGCNQAGAPCADLTPGKTITPSHIAMQTAFGELTHNLELKSHWEETSLAERRKNGFEHLPIAAHHYLRVQKLDHLSRWLLAVLPQKVLKWFLVFPLLMYLIVFLVSEWNRHDNYRQMVGELLRRTKASTKLLVVVLSFLAVHFIVGGFIWLCEFWTESASGGTDLAGRGFLGTTIWLMAHLMDADDSILLKSPMSLVWLGLLKAGYALTSAGLVVGAGIEFWQWVRRKTVKKLVVLVGAGPSWNAVQTELRQIGKGFVSVVQPTDELFDPKNAGKTLEVVLGATRTEVQTGEVVKKAEAFIVLSDTDVAKEQNLKEVDLWVAQEVERIDRWRKEGPRKVPLIAEVRYPTSVVLVEKAGADKVVCVQRFGAELIVQSVKKPQILEFFEELVRTSANTNEVYFDSIDELFVEDRSLSFEVAAAAWSKRYDMGDAERRLVVGILKGNDSRVLVNPVGDDGILLPGDRLMVIARSDRDTR